MIPLMTTPLTTLAPLLPRPQLTRQLAAHYLALSVLLDSVDQLTTPQGVLDALHDAREAIWSGLEIAKAQGS